MTQIIFLIFYVILELLVLSFPHFEIFEGFVWKLQRIHCFLFTLSYTGHWSNSAFWRDKRTSVLHFAITMATISSSGRYCHSHISHFPSFSNEISKMTGLTDDIQEPIYYALSEQPQLGTKNRQKVGAQEIYLYVANQSGYNVYNAYFGRWVNKLWVNGIRLIRVQISTHLR